MADTRILLAGLKQYRATLDKHLSSLVAEYQSLSISWQRFSGVYAGEAADEFRTHWMGTSRRFQEYIENTQRIGRMLDERIEYLERTNRPEGTLT